jgi:hypothetical protein
MKRIERCSVGLSVAGLSFILAIAPARLSAQQTPGPNPLRTATRSHKADSKAATAVGTSVRPNSGKGTGKPAVAKAVAQQPVQARRSTGRPQHSVQPATYRRRVARQDHVEGLPLGETIHDEPILQGTVTVPDHPGEIIGEDLADHMGGMTGGDCGGGCDGGCGGGGCDGGCCGSSACMQCCSIPCPRISWDDLTIFAGVQGFTGPKNRGQTGSFGFHEGFNWGSPVPCTDCLGIQLGARFAQSNLSAAEFTPDNRNQVFLTGGLFRRVDWGLQGGIVFDYLHDDWYTETVLSQLRAEIGWVFPCSHEIGFWMTQSLEEDTAVSRVFTTPVVNVLITETWEATDLYAFYYRHHFQEWEGATGRVFAGWSGGSDGYIGTDFHAPLTCDLALEAGFAYLVPEQAEGPAAIGNEQESWNVAVSLVWYPGCGTAFGKSYSAPLFNVADNGSFMVDRIR